MTWRVISISNRSKLDYKMDYLVVRQGESFTRIHLSEISTLIVESTAVSITSYLLNELINRKINVVFCDERKMPSSFLIGCYGSADTAEKLKMQITWNRLIKAEVWQKIIIMKIENQAIVLKIFNKDEPYCKLISYADEVSLGDKTNREGFAAKVYFNSLLGANFSRKSDSDINASLNYGYTILLSAFARAITAYGCITQLGIWHRGGFNQFNLACDLMEPFRPLVDKLVISKNLVKFDKTSKTILKNLLNEEITFEGRVQYLSNIIPMYTNSILFALNTSCCDDIKKFHL